MTAAAPANSREISADVSRLAEHLFRHEAGRLISVLTGIFGIDRLQWAEDVVQDALVKALQSWSYYGIPQNPAAWLTQTAKNLALDLIRREKVFRDKEPQIITFIEQWSESGETATPLFEGEIQDGRLRLMFACCHPLIPQDAQIALALKTLCGFSPAEIAKAFLTTEAAIAKRLTRARQRIHELRIPFEIPSGPELVQRVEAVLQTIYLLFNEGYKASHGDRVVREDLCHEAIRLGELLAGHAVGNQPRTHALLALMLLNAARLPARTDPEGHLLLLKDQNRSVWDRGCIGRGMMHLARSASGSDLSSYHLQAGIAACHCAAPDYPSTDWTRILSLYDQLIRIDPSPVVALNRAVAVARVHGPQAALEIIETPEIRRALESYYLFHAVLGELRAELRDFAAARGHLHRALGLTALTSEQAFLSKRLQEFDEAQLTA